MLSPEILKQVRRIEISTRKWVDEALTGRFKSQFKGQGVAFSEHRQYVAGDDVRHIDWKVSARSREPLIKKYEEERELVVMLVVDLSASSQFGSKAASKQTVLAELAGLLATAAGRSGDRVGAVLFDGAVARVLPPRKGRGQILRILQEVLSFNAKSPGTAMADALRSVERVMKHQGIVFVLSDLQTEGFERELTRVSMRHDVVVVRVADDAEWSPPVGGEIWIEDPETGARACVDLGSPRFRDWLTRFQARREKETAGVITAAAAECVTVKTTEDYGSVLVQFLKKRASKRRAR